MKNHVEVQVEKGVIKVFNRVISFECSDEDSFRFSLISSWHRVTRETSPLAQQEVAVSCCAVSGRVSFDLKENRALPPISLSWARLSSNQPHHFLYELLSQILPPTSPLPIPDAL